MNYVDSKHKDSLSEEFFESCKANDAQRLKKLIDAGVDVNATTSTEEDDGVPALSYALMHGSMDCAGILLKHPNLDIYDAFHYAVDKGNIEHVKLLLAHGVDIASKKLIDRPILAAGVTPEVARYLISAGLDVRHPDVSALACQNDVETVRILIDANADVNTIDCINFTPLMWYLNGDEYNLDIIELLASKTTNINTRGSRNNQSALLKAFYRVATVPEAPEAIKILLKYGAQPTIDDVVEVSEKYDTMRAILQAKVDPNLTEMHDGESRTLLSELQSYNTPEEVLELLVAHGAVELATCDTTTADTDTAGTDTTGNDERDTPSSGTTTTAIPATRD